MNQIFLNNFSLENKKALILGASKGIGLAISQFLSNQGATIFAVARGKYELASLINSLPSQGNRYLAIDLAKENDIAELISTIQNWGIPDVIVANLYIRTKSEKINSLYRESTEFILDDLKCLFKLFPICIPAQRENKFGRWIGISSMSANLGGPGQAVYSIKKNALESLFKTLALEEGRNYITANIISPGFILTPGVNSNYSQDNISIFSKMNAMGRAGSPEEIAHTASFLASPLASYITGVTIPVCGGYNLGWAIQNAIEGKLNL